MGAASGVQWEGDRSWEKYGELRQQDLLQVLRVQLDRVPVLHFHRRDVELRRDRRGGGDGDHDGGGLVQGLEDFLRKLEDGRGVGERAAIVGRVV